MLSRRAMPMLVLAMASVAACGDAASSSGSAAPVAIVIPGAASLPELTGPWRPDPLGLDPAMYAKIGEHCRRDMQGRPGLTPLFIDVRGEEVAIARLSGPGGGVGCDAIRITPDGSMEGAGGGWSTNQPERLPDVAMHALANLQRGEVRGGSLTVQGYSVQGQAGSGVAVVRVEVPGVPVMTATLQNGWFAAWWPFEIPDRQFGDPRPPEPVVIVRAYDLLGNLLSEARP